MKIFPRGVGGIQDFRDARPKSSSKEAHKKLIANRKAVFDDAKATFKAALEVTKASSRWRWGIIRSPRTVKIWITHPERKRNLKSESDS